MIIHVEMGEGVILESPYIIKSVGLGSCVAVAMYDHESKIGGLAHIMFPVSSLKPKLEFIIQKTETIILNSEFWILNSSTYQYADTAIPAILEEMRIRGCSRRNITAKIAGGAKMFSSYSGIIAGIGEQNAKSIKDILKSERIPLAGMDIGGRHGRSVEFYLSSGRVVVKGFGKEDKEI